MTNQPEALRNLIDAIAEIQHAVDMTMHDAQIDPDLKAMGEISADFALEATLDFTEAEDLPMLPADFAGKFLDLLAEYSKF